MCPTFPPPDSAADESIDWSAIFGILSGFFMKTITGISSSGLAFAIFSPRSGLNFSSDLDNPDSIAGSVKSSSISF